MATAQEVITMVESSGGRLAITDEGALRYVDVPAQLVDELRQHRDEIIATVNSWVLVPVACRCAKWGFPHIHDIADRRRASKQWNMDSSQPLVAK